MDASCLICELVCFKAEEVKIDMVKMMPSMAQNNEVREGWRGEGKEVDNRILDVCKISVQYV